MKLHKENSESLAHTLDDQEKENAKLKQRMVEPEASVIPWLLFIEPLSVVHLIEEWHTHAHKFDNITRLFNGVIFFVVEGIKTIMDLISKAFEILENVHKWVLA